MTRAEKPLRASARVVSLLLAVGVSVSACTGAPTGAGSDPGQQTASGTAAPAATGEEHADDHGEHADEHADETGGDDHAHHDEDVETAAPTTGPPRPADPDLECGTTVLDDLEQVTRYCDEGSARFVVADDKDTTVEGATCEDRGAFFLAHFGTNYSDDFNSRGDYLGLALEEMPETSGTAPIYALELTLDGYKTPLAGADVEVSRSGGTVDLTLTGELADGRDLLVEATCEVAAD